jgi:hypothetical protein
MKNMKKRFAGFIAGTALSAALVTTAGAGAATAAGRPAAPRPAARLALASSDIAAGSTAELRYSTAHLPAGSAVRLQERDDTAGTGWITTVPLGKAGTVKAPAAPAGDYDFRVLVSDHGRTVATSPAAHLTVEGQASGTSGTSVFGSIWNWVWHEAASILSEGAVAVVLAWLGL